MLLTKILLTALSAFMVGVNLTPALNKTPNLLRNEQTEDVIIPSSIADPIHRYAKAIGDTNYDANIALLEWLESSDNLGGLSFLDTDPEVFNEETNRKTKDCFYALAYIQQYLPSGVSGCKAPIDATREVLDKLMPIMYAFSSFVESQETHDYEQAYSDCKEIYLAMHDLIECVQNDYYCVYSQPVETFISGAKKSLENRINNVKNLGFDDSFNQYSYLQSAVKGFGTFTSKNPITHAEYSTEIIDYVLFNENTHIDTYFSKEFIDFDVADYDDAISGLTTPAEYEVVSAPFIKKIDYQLFTYLLTYNFSKSYIDNPTSLKDMVNNYGPLSYKILDFAEATRDNDSPNIVYTGLEIMNDFEMLFELLGLKTNKKDLKYEKYLANARLGSLLYKENTHYKFSKLLANLDKINAVDVTDSTYEEGVAEINNLVSIAYKNLNVDLVASSDQAVLFFANGLEDLASREQGYSFELRKMLNHDHAFPIETKMLSDYGNNMLYVNVVWIDMVLTDKNSNLEIDHVDNPIDVMFGIYNLQINTDVRVYRYDEVEDKVVSLSNEETTSGSDYFTLDIDDVCVHTKDFGTYAIAFINRLIKEEVEDFRHDLTELQNQINALNSQISSKDATITQLQATITELQERITALEADSSAKQALIDSLQIELDAAKASLNEKINEITTLEKTISEKNALNILFIVLTCAFAISTAGLVVLYVLKNKKEHKE